MGLLTLPRILTHPVRDFEMEAQNQRAVIGHGYAIGQHQHKAKGHQSRVVVNGLLQKRAFIRQTYQQRYPR
ncbi:TPA: hypothetical protein ACOEP6_004903 [Enterobacter ludwigii]